MPKPRNLSVPKSLQADLDLFELHLESENKSPKTIVTYLGAARWFASEGIPAGSRKKAPSWDDVTAKDIKLWIKRLLVDHADSYANNQYRALQAFWKWYSAERRFPTPWPGWGLRRSVRTWCPC